MTKPIFSWARFLELPVVGIMRNLSVEEIIQILQLYVDAGLTTIEITMNTPGAEDLIRTAVSTHSENLNVGAGTVCNMNDLEMALKAGAQFIVTPLIDEQVIDTCVQMKIPVFSGAFTPTEIYKAWDLGADMVKVFPASLGPQYIKELRGPLNKIKLLPTGGISLDNCREFLSAGAAGLGIGGALFNKELIRAKNYDAVAMDFAQFAKKIAECKSDEGSDRIDT